MTIKTDGRRLSHEVSEYIRIQAVKRVIKGGESPEKVIASFGLNASNIYKWLRKHKKGGLTALQSTKGGGKPSKVSDEECKKLQKWLIKDPRQLNFDFGLWTLQMIQELIKIKFEKEVGLSTVKRVMERIGYTPQRPIFRAYQQNKDKVEKYLKEEYPEIEREAKCEGRIIFFSDEAGFRSDAHGGTTWAKKGQTPIVKATGARFGTNCISAVSKRGDLRFMLYEGSFVQQTFITFLERLMTTTDRPITIVVDGHPVHHGKGVKSFVESTNGKIKLYFLPPYSPELNPDELVWNNTKSNVKRKLANGPQQFISVISSYLHSIQKRPSLIQSLFSHPSLAYITV